MVNFHWTNRGPYKRARVYMHLVVLSIIFVLLNLYEIQTRRVRHDAAMSSKWSGE